MVRLAAAPGHEDAAGELLMAFQASFGSCGAHELENQGQREWRVYFTEEQYPANFVEALQSEALRQQLSPFTLLGLEDVEQENWHDAWRAYFQPVRLSDRLEVLPSWHKDSHKPAPNDVAIFIEPGMAFGTGTHATTQLCLKLTEKELKSGQNVLDIGTGSAILSIAAVKLGASYAVGFDKDPDICENVTDNLKLNEMDPAKLVIYVGTLDQIVAAKFDLVLCNMLSQNFLPLLGKIPYYCPKGGKLILSGFLISEREEVHQAVLATGMKIVETAEQAEWAALVAQKQD